MRVKGPVPFASLTSNMVPMVVLHQIATSPPPPPRFSLILSPSVSSTGVKGKRKRAQGGGVQEEEGGGWCPQAPHFLEWDHGGRGAGGMGEAKGGPPP